MKRFLAIFAALALSAGTLAGCGGGGGTSSATSETSSKSESSSTASPSSSAAESSKAESPAEASGASAEITWWAFPTFQMIDETSGKYEQSIIDAFAAKNPNIKVNLEMIDFTSGPDKITTALQGGTGPDIIFDAPGRIIDWGKGGYLAPLDDIFTDELKKDIGNENVVKACSDGTNFYMYPLSVGPFVMAWNKDMLEKAGALDLLPQTGDRTLTTDQFTEINQKLHDAGFKNAYIFCSGQGGDQGTRAFISNLYSSQITDNDLTKYTINDANGVKGLQYVMDQIVAGNLENGSQYNGGEAIEQFANGLCSSTILWGAGNDGTSKAMLDASGVTRLVTSLPSDDGKPDLEYLVNGFCVFDNKDADKIAAGKEFVKFVCDDPEWGPKNVKQTNVFPARQSFGDLYPGDADKAFYNSQSQYFGVYYNTIDGFSGMRPAWFNNLQAAFAGDKTAQQALDDFVNEANQAIADAQ